MLQPKLFTTLQNYSRATFANDLISGFIVGIVALPLAIAFAIASGVSPERGLFTAIVAGFLISAFGGSKVQIGGPTGAFVVIVYGIVQQYGLNGLMVATMLAGVFLIIMGLARFGSAIKFIPYPVVVGFTTGIALLIFSSQIKDALGLTMGDVPSDFLEKWAAYAHTINTTNYAACCLTAGSLLLMLLWPKVSRKIPGSLVALLLGTAAVAVLHLPVETIGSRFGSIPSSLPMPSLPNFSLPLIKQMFQPALTLALLAGIEALLSAVVADGMTGGKHRSNMELVAQGIANIASPLFGGIPATGAIARTATNIRNGGKTPVAGIVHALVLLLIVLFFGKWAVLIPLPVLAAILIVVAYNMSEWRSFRSMLKGSRSDTVVLLTTFVLTVVLDLTVAIELGMLMALFLFMRRMATVSNVSVMTNAMSDDDEEETEDAMNIEHHDIPDGVEVYEINGPLFFGAAYKFKEALQAVEKPPKVRIIRMRNVPAIDATGIHILEEFVASSKKEGTTVLLSGVHAQPKAAIAQSPVWNTIGEENVVENILLALERARSIVHTTK